MNASDNQPTDTQQQLANKQVAANAQARAAILAKIGSALTNKSAPLVLPDQVSAIYQPLGTDALAYFVDSFIARKGLLFSVADVDALPAAVNSFVAEMGYSNVFGFEEGLESLLKPNFDLKITDEDFMKADCGISFAEVLIARTGSIIVTSMQQAGRRLGIYPPTHIVIAFASQLVDDIEDGLSFITTKYNGKLPSMINLVTGASRTADIEKTLVLGAHGPKELVMFLVNDTHVG